MSLIFPKKRRKKQMKRIYNLSQAAEFLKKNDNFIILTHVYPDGDTS